MGRIAIAITIGILVSVLFLVLNRQLPAAAARVYGFRSFVGPSWRHATSVIRRLDRCERGCLWLDRIRNSELGAEGGLSRSGLWVERSDTHRVTRTAVALAAR